MKTNAGTKQGNKLWSAGGAGFSSATDDWATPPEVFAALDREFSFDLDVCASATNHKCARFFTVADDGLAQEWTGTVWMNPPYGRAIGAWMKKAADAADAGATVVCLVPARPDTGWWHDQVLARACEVRLVRGRLKFGNATTAAPFPSAVVVYRPGGSQLSVTPWTPPRPAKKLQSAAAPVSRAASPPAPKQKYAAGTLAIAVTRSMNAKIGDAATTYAEQRSCPTSCRFYDGGGCYAEQGRLGFSVTGPLNQAAAMVDATPEDIARAEAEQIDGLKVKAGRPLRIHTLGDCKTDEAAEIVSDAAGRYVERGGGAAWTYTHAWRDVDVRSWGDVNVLASCETPEDVEAAHERGYPTAIVVEKFADRKLYQADGVNILPCPAQTAPPEKAVTCASCELCFNAPRLFRKRLTIAFEVHGTEDGKRRSRLALTDPNNPNRKLSSRTLIPKFIKVFVKRHGRQPTNAEIAKALGFSVGAISEMRRKLAAAKNAGTP